MTLHRTFVRLLPATAILAALAGASRPIAAQAVTSPEGKARLASAMSDLRNLVTAQEAYYAEHNRYSDDLSKTQWKPSSGNSARLVNPAERGWGAELTGSGIAGSCIIYVNLAAEQRPRTKNEQKAFDEGEPACDGDGETEAVHLARGAAFAMERQLAFVARLEEQHFGKNGVYAASVEQLDGYRANPAIRVSITVSAPGERLPGWYATAVHSQYPSASCLVRSGWGPWGRSAVTAKEKRRPSLDLQVVCDDLIAQ